MIFSVRSTKSSPLRYQKSFYAFAQIQCVHLHMLIMRKTHTTRVRAHTNSHIFASYRLFSSALLMRFSDENPIENLINVEQPKIESMKRSIN